MEGDYQMIASRYSKLFDALDRSLRSRVFELDQVPADLASRQMPRILKRLRDSGAQYLISGTESLPTGQSAVSLKIKGNTNKVINSIKRSLLDTVQLKQELQSGVLDQKVDTRRAYYLPVLVIEADAPRPPGTILSIVSAGGQAFQLAGSKEIERKLRDTYAELPWAPTSGRDRAYVAAAFEKLLAGKHLDPRLQDEVSRLHRASEWRSPRGGGA
jgi:plasmid stabilization system protein ParE